MGEDKTALQRHIETMTLEDKTVLHQHIEKMKKVLEAILNSKLDSCAISEKIHASSPITKDYTQREFNLFFLNVLNILGYLPDKNFAELYHLIDDTNITREIQKLLMITVLDGVREAAAIEEIDE